MTRVWFSRAFLVPGGFTMSVSYCLQRVSSECLHQRLGHVGHCLVFWFSVGEAAEQPFSDLPLFIEETKLRLTRNGREERRPVISRKRCK